MADPAVTGATPGRDVEVPLTAIRDTAVAALRHVGPSGYESDTVVTALLAADLRGRHSQGIARLPSIVDRVRAGVIVPGAMSDVSLLGPSLATLDGNFGFGQVTAVDACHRVGELARQSGVGLVLVRQSNHFGMLTHYLERLARSGLVTIIMTTTEATVRPAGGIDPLLGANPIGVAFPADPPFVLDMSSAATTVGKVTAARRRGERIPLTWAVDAAGRPTDDPQAALNGAINAIGGVKGYGLGLAVSLLAGVLTGTETGRRVQGGMDGRLVSTKGDLYLALDPRRLPWGEEVSRRATAFLAEIRRSRPVDPARPVLVPGDRGRARISMTSEEDRMLLPRRLWSALNLLAGGRFD